MINSVATMGPLALTISTSSLAASCAVGVACALLSVIVVSRRWAFIGEGVSHSGFGGAGFAWMIMLMFPPAIDRPWALYVAVICFCLGTAVAIGYLSRGNRVTGDAAIGIFLVASLAFGFLAQQVFRHVRHGADPPGFDALLFGQINVINARMALAAVCISAAVIIVVAALWKEILAYCLDPLMAQASGVRTGAIHYLLMVLIAVMIMIGMPITSSLLMTALLVLPGVTANLISRQLKTVLSVAVAVSLLSAITGVWLHGAWRFIPTGPAIVLALFMQFLFVYVLTRAARHLN